MIELPGLNVSTFARTVAEMTPCVIELMRTIGVFPMASRMLLQIFRLGDFHTATSYRVAVDALFASGPSAASRWAGWTTGTAMPAALGRP